MNKGLICLFADPFGDVFEAAEEEDLQRSPVPRAFPFTKGNQSLCESRATMPVRKLRKSRQLIRCKHLDDREAGAIRKTG